MSIWSDLGRGILGAAGRRVEREIIGPVGTISTPGISGPIKTFPGAAGSIGATQAGFLPAIVSGAGRVLRSPLGQGVIGGALGATVFGGGGGNGCPAGFHLAKDGSGRCVRNRRMNVGNAKAARRAVRRIKGARKLLQSIEKQMPRRPASRGKTQHHHHPAAGG